MHHYITVAAHGTVCIGFHFAQAQKILGRIASFQDVKLFCIGGEATGKDTE
jgi:hypothetical protein